MRPTSNLLQHLSFQACRPVAFVVCETKVTASCNWGVIRLPLRLLRTSRQTYCSPPLLLIRVTGSGEKSAWPIWSRNHHTSLRLIKPDPDHLDLIILWPTRSNQTIKVRHHLKDVTRRIKALVPIVQAILIQYHKPLLVIRQSSLNSREEKRTSEDLLNPVPSWLIEQIKTISYFVISHLLTL